MKSILKKLISFISTIKYIVFGKNIKSKNSTYYLSKLKIAESNSMELTNSKCVKTNIFIEGNDNEIKVNSALISNSKINITGANNLLLLEPEVKLRGATIHIRGDNCIIKFGRGTTTGGVRMVNVGCDNNIEVGKNCLFADNIEIWASDTHSIYDKNNKMINPEKPIKIGDRVWIGSYVKVLKGVKINDDSIIGMATLVTKDVPKGTISVGNPNRMIKNNVSWKLQY